MPPSGVCASLKKQIAALEHTLAELTAKLAADKAKGDAVQVADDEAGIAIAEEELASLQDLMVENGCYEHSDPPPPPPTLKLVQLTSPLHPGEDLRVRWEFSYPSAYFGPTSTYGIGNLIFIQLFLGYYSSSDPALRLASKMWELTDVAFPPTSKFSLGPTVGATTTIVPTDSLAAQLYKVPPTLGTGITLHVDGNGPEGPYDLGIELDTAKWPLDSGWWTWTVPDLQRKAWKSDHYTLAGILTNGTAAAMLGADITLMESEDGKAATPITTINSHLMAAGAKFTATFPSIGKDWEFITGAPLWKIDGPMSKVFDYHVTFTFSNDIYGNVYDEPIDSSSVRVIVTVSVLKQSAAFTAQGAAIASIAFAAAAAAAFAGLFTAPAGIPLLALAAGAAAVATTAGLIAKDPPTPDPQYRVAIELPIEPEHAAHARLPVAVRFWKTLQYILDLELARLKLPGRLMAAVYFDDQPVQAMHRQTHDQIRAKIIRAISQLHSIAPATKHELARDLPLTPQLITEIAARARAGTVALPEDRSVDPAVRAQLIELLKSSEAMSRAATTSLAEALDDIVRAMLTFGAHLPHSALDEDR